MSEIPSGTITFLFMDIEGSIQLWERDPEGMKTALAHLEAITRQAVAEQGGYAYKMGGGNFQVAFETAPAALVTVIEVQRKLNSESMGEIPMKVRMALHTGVAEACGDDYMGPALSRITCLLDVGYGRQVLLTQVTRELVEDVLPSGASLRDLGVHRLKDLERPEHIYQFEASGLQADFPPIKTLDSFPNNLPLNFTSFIGRAKEIPQVKLLVISGSASSVYTAPSSEYSRLVTLTGSGGTGKTRLAVHVAADLLELFPDGVWLVELAPLTDPGLIPQTVAGILGVPVKPGKPEVHGLIDYLKQKELLLILDNCEHVVEAVAQLAELLLQSCPELHILATSREILGATGELPFRVPSLSVPAAHHLPAHITEKDLEGLFEFEAVRLFCDRATVACPDFKLTSANAAAVIQVCQRLDGIPLALELAAARVRMLSVQQIAIYLDDAFRLLTGGSRTVLPRHQALRALIDWSYNLLTQTERAMLLRLSVFSGGWTLEAAEAVLPELNDSFDIFGLLAQLVDKSLVLVEQEKDLETRYRLLETIRQYASEKLSDLGGGEAVRDRHLAYHARLVSEAAPHLRARDQVHWLDRLEGELDNLRTALEWSKDHQVEVGLRMAADLFWFWHIRGYASEGTGWLKRLLATEEGERGHQPMSPSMKLVRARALNTSGFIKFYQDEIENARALFVAARPLLEELGPAGKHDLAAGQMALGMMIPDQEQAKALEQDSLAVFRAEGDVFNMAECLQQLGFLAWNRGEFEESKAYLLEDLALRKQINDLDGMGTALRYLGEIAFIHGKSVEAGMYLNDSLELFHKVGNKRYESMVLFSQTGMAFAMGDIGLASQKCEQAIAIGHELNEKRIVAGGLYYLGRVSWNQGDYDQARGRYEDTLSIAQETGDRRLLAMTYFGLGIVAFSQRRYADAYYHLKDNISLWQEIDDHFDIGLSLVVLAGLAHALCQMETAARFLGLTDRLLPSYVAKFLFPVENQTFENIRFMVQDALGEKAFQQAWSAGQEMTQDQAWDRILSLGSSIESQPTEAYLGNGEAGNQARFTHLRQPETMLEPLSQRELEVLKMLATGYTNLEIAQKLYIDVGTVKSHNTHIFAKLDVKNRIQAVTRARRMGLV